MVAGDACDKSSVSNNMRVPIPSSILSPLERHNSLESSSVEFRFSTHSGSMGPSRIAHLQPNEAHDGYGRPVSTIFAEVQSTMLVFGTSTTGQLWELFCKKKFRIVLLSTPSTHSKVRES